MRISLSRCLNVKNTSFIFKKKDALIIGSKKKKKMNEMKMGENWDSKIKCVCCPCTN